MPFAVGHVKQRRALIYNMYIRYSCACLPHVCMYMQAMALEMCLTSSGTHYRLRAPVARFIVVIVVVLGIRISRIVLLILVLVLEVVVVVVMVVVVVVIAVVVVVVVEVVVVVVVVV